jgi:hypothetical protein
MANINTTITPITGTVSGAYPDGTTVNDLSSDTLNGKQESDAQLNSVAGLSYAGNSLKVMRVNAGETSFELASLAGGGATALDGLSDCVTNYTDGNMFLGDASGGNIAAGVNNTGLGKSSLANTANGSFNTSVGRLALADSDSTANTAIGYGALQTASGGYNVSAGYAALQYVTTGEYNIGIGKGAGSALATGNNCIVIGGNADVSGVAATNEITIGYGSIGQGDNTALIGNASTTDVYFGDGTNTILHGDGSALTNLPSGATTLNDLDDCIASYPDNNVGVGQGALESLTTGYDNTATGVNALAVNSTGYGSVAVGSGALANSNGQYNVGVGTQAFANVTSGAINTGVGQNVGTTLATGNYNTLIGDSADVGSASLSNAIAIGQGAVVNATNTWIVGTLGKKQAIQEGGNAAMGVSTLIAGTVTVSNNIVTANSRIFITSQDDNGGTPGFIRVASRSAGSDFTITSSSGSDTSIVAWELKEPN